MGALQGALTTFSIMKQLMSLTFSSHWSSFCSLNGSILLIHADLSVDSRDNSGIQKVNGVVIKCIYSNLKTSKQSTNGTFFPPNMQWRNGKKNIYLLRMTELNFHNGRIESLLQQLSGKTQFTKKSRRFCVQNINKQSCLFQALNSLKNISKRSCLHPKRKKKISQGQW